MRLNLVCTRLNVILIKIILTFQMQTRPQILALLYQATHTAQFTN